MGLGKKALKEELKRMKASMKELTSPKKKPNLNLCMKCKQDAGNNFILIYKKNNELKGKICTSCSKEKLFDLTQ